MNPEVSPQSQTFCVVARNLSTTGEIHPELRRMYQEQHSSKRTSATDTIA